MVFQARLSKDEYVVEKYCPNNFIDTKCAFVVRKKDEEPFLYLIDSGLSFDTRFYYIDYLNPPIPKLSPGYQLEGDPGQDTRNE